MSPTCAGISSGRSSGFDATLLAESLLLEFALEVVARDQDRVGHLDDQRGRQGHPGLIASRGPAARAVRRRAVHQRSRRHHVGAEAAAGPVDPNEPQAKSLGYVKDSTKVDAKANPNFKPGQHCANCLQVPKGKEGAPGAGGQVPCNIFAGRLVEANGWCKVWVKRP